MFKFKLLVQNRPQAHTYYRNGYIKANSIQNAIENLNIIFNGFIYNLVNIKKLNS